ncbi:MAG: tRNA (adenosine(37)-N6)-dimethylallyltransferase MiaA [Candidatus Krumholzibacteriia bacterium]
MTSYPGVAIMGATASGKSRVAIELARSFGGEIISMDSRQVYRGLDIGTAKVAEADRDRVAHHLIDVLDPDEANNAGRHVARALDVAEGIAAAGGIPFFVGGTGFYFRVLFEGLIHVRIPEADLEAIRGRLGDWATGALYAELLRRDPERAGELSRNDRVRIMRALEIHDYTGKPHSRLIKEQKRRHPWCGLRIVLTLPRARLRRRIADRTREMFESGWVEEVRGLLASGVRPDAPAMGSLGYAVIARAIIAGGAPDACVDEVITQTQQYAKRQETFFRSVGGAHWVDVTATEPVSVIAGLIRGNDDFKSHLT